MSKLYNKMPPLPEKGTKSKYKVSTKQLLTSVMNADELKAKKKAEALARARQRAINTYRDASKRVGIVDI